MTGKEANTVGEKKDNLVASFTESRSTASSYSKEWKELFSSCKYLENLRQAGIVGKFRSSRFRSVCWRIYLEVFPQLRKDWIRSVRKSRSFYCDLKKQLVVNPRSPGCSDLKINNPLSLNDKSPWNQFFQDNNLRSIIYQDVVRTFPNVQFFQDQDVQELMVDILFFYARNNMKLSYKQGMHELLAPIIFVLHSDHQAFLHAKELESLETEVQEIMDPEYIEHDAYTMFCQIMKTVEPWYISKELTAQQVHVRKLSVEPFSKQHDVSPSNAIVFKLARIHDHLLKRFDPELRKCLEDNDIIPQFYGIRWIRLLFGREFPMQDLLVIWDAIFSDGLSLDLVDYIFTAMLIYIRDKLINKDYASCLSVLMRYPPAPDIQYFINLALHLRDPKHCQKPVTSAFMNHTPRKSVTINKEPIKQSEPTKGISVISKFAFKTGRKGNERPGSLVLNSTLQEIDLSPDDRCQKRKSSVPTPILSPRKTSNLSKCSGLSASSTNLSIPNDSLCQNKSNLNKPLQHSKIPFTTGPVTTSIQSKRLNYSAKKNTTVDREHAILTGRLKDKETLINFCSLQLDENIEKLKRPYKEIDLQDILQSLEKTRDILNGTIKFSSNLLEKENIPRITPTKDVELGNFNSSQNVE